MKRGMRPGGAINIRFNTAQWKRLVAVKLALEKTTGFALSWTQVIDHLLTKAKYS